MVTVDLMFVDDGTWERLAAEPLERDVAGHPVIIPQPEHLIALKLHSASSPERQRTEMDWEDIRQIIRVCGIDQMNPAFREMVLRYGGETALNRIESF